MVWSGEGCRQAFHCLFHPFYQSFCLCRRLVITSCVGASETCFGVTTIFAASGRMIAHGEQAQAWGFVRRGFLPGLSRWKASPCRGNCCGLSQGLLSLGGWTCCSMAPAAVRKALTNVHWRLTWAGRLEQHRGLALLRAVQIWASHRLVVFRRPGEGRGPSAWGCSQTARCLYSLTSCVHHVQFQSSAPSSFSAAWSSLELRLA